LLYKQVGTASLDLGPLLRQGRDFCEVLTELPVMLADSAMGGAPGGQVRTWDLECYT
jgi:hypothetical protein